MFNVTKTKFSFLTLIALPLLVVVLLAGTLKAEFFHHPQLCSPEEFIEKQNSQQLDMCWQFGEKSSFHFVSKNEEMSFEIRFQELPEQYADLIARVKHLMVEKERSHFTFTYRLKAQGVEEKNIIVNSPIVNAHDDSYTVQERRVFTNANPQLMGEYELAQVLKKKTVLFYTGAGLSIASGVPGMDELCRLLCLGHGESFPYSLEEYVVNPRKMAERIRSFHQACFSRTPSKAHLALKELSLYKSCRIVTENLDCLHEASGIAPYRVDAKTLCNEPEEKSLKGFDCVVCIGLSYDDRGFLAWYKAKNPNGKIIAIDFKQPSYLADDDYFVVGDIQEILPAMAKAIIL